MWSDPSARSAAPSRRGFTLIEVMVALIVAVVMTTALVRFFANVRHEAVRLREQVDAWAVARSVLDSVPSGAVLAPGTTVGAAGAYGWRLEAVSMAQILPPAPAPMNDDGGDDAEDPPPVPMQLRVVVTGPRGGTVSLETVRLAGSGGGDAP
jgi:prepilin-type N-terminal cleavage/methylation domain-containing protein